MAGLDLPMEPRRRYSYVFEAEDPPTGHFPLIIDPTGIHVRREGSGFLAGCGPMGQDKAMDPGDFAEEPGIWEEKLWPLLAARIPAFERLRVRTSWVGHYAFNTLDQNAVVGRAPGFDNFFLVNGFSGHGLQQSPAMGRALSEIILYGHCRSLDLSELSPDRLLSGAVVRERNVI